MKFARIFGVAAGLVLTSAIVFAQQPAGSVTGTVTAPDGARLPDVTLEFTNLESGAVVRVTSSESGLFRAGGLPPGLYVVEAVLRGFEPLVVADVIVTAAQTVTLPIELRVSTQRETVQVIGRSPRDNIEASAIRESRARDVGEALASMPGLSKIRKGALASDVVVRGMQGRDLNVLIDGERIYGACASEMDPPAFHVDFAEVDRIEVSKGPFDVKNQGGLGGIVNIVTARPEAGWHGTLSTTVASAGTFAPSGTVSIAGPQISGLVGASFRRADPYRDGDGQRLTDRANYRIEERGREAYAAWTGWGRLAWAPKPGSNLEASFTRQDADTMLYPYLLMDALDDTADRAAVRYEVGTLPGGWQQLSIQGYFTQVDHWMTDQYRETSRPMPRGYSMANQANTKTFGGKAEANWGGVTMGAEAFRRRWVTETSLAASGYTPQFAIPDVSIDTMGIYAEHARALSSSLRLEYGGRLDYSTSRADAAKANTALYRAYHGVVATEATDVLPAGYVRTAYLHDSGVKVTVGIGHVGRVPDQQERYYGLRRMGSDWVGNPSLEPSRNTGIDADVGWTGSGVFLGVNAYLYRIDNFILVADQARQQMVPGVMNTVARSYANADVQMRGLEASGSWLLTSRLFLSGDVSMVRGTRLGTAPGDAGYLPEIPPLKAYVRLRFDTGRVATTAEIAGAARQSRVDEALLEESTPGYAVLNLRARLRLARAYATIGVDNIFDRAYIEHLSYQRDPFRSGARIYEPGRTLSANLEWRF
jgi:iron complex outermembrane receptor protein